MCNLCRFAVAAVLLTIVVPCHQARSQSGYTIKTMRQKAQKVAALVAAGKEARARASELANKKWSEEAAAEYAAALEMFVAVRRLAPGNITALLEEAWIHNEIGEYEAATESANAALEIAPDNHEAWRELGYAQWKLVDHPRAIASLGRAIQRNRTDLSSYGYLLGLLEEDGDDTAADEVRRRKQAVERAMEENPFNPPVEVIGKD